MSIKAKEKQKEAKATIEKLGGVEKVAELIDSKSTQRVQNWLRRGIPPSVKLEFPDLFLNQKSKQNTEYRN